MLDYNMMSVAKMEYEERIQKMALERRMPTTKTGPVRRALFGLGDVLVNVGGRLKAQYEPMQPPTMTAGGHAR